MTQQAAAKPLLFACSLCFSAMLGGCFASELTDDAARGNDVAVCCGAAVRAQALKQRFKRVAWFRPKATRSESKEIFLVGRGYLGHVTRDPSS